MRGATVEELGHDPVGRYVAGATFVHFCAHAGLWGIVLWGRPGKADAFELGRSLVLELAPPASPHASIVDASRLEGGDETAFRALERYVVRHGDALKDWVTRLAIVHAKGLGGAIVAGASEVLALPYPVRSFEDPRAALAWLGEPAPGLLAASLDVMYAEASGTPPFLGALRALLDANLRGLAVAAAAKALGMSDRSLQRRLTDVGTTFQLEMIDARVRKGKALLRDGNAPLTTIAIEAGCASLQHFNALFRKRTGELPSAWRLRARAEKVR